MNLQVDFRSKIPLSEQIYAGLLRWITTEIHSSDEQLPTVRELADQIQVNFNTVARVYRRLDLEGWISTQQGRGTYIMPRSQEQAVAQGFSEEVFLTGVEKYIEDEASHFKIVKQELWKLLQRHAGQHLGSQPIVKQNTPGKTNLHARPHFLKWDPFIGPGSRKENKYRRFRTRK
jgi:DNA-binding transcriptional regulator YhcF (GntR family)